MKSFTRTELKIIRILLDNEGHPNWDLEERLNLKPPNISRSLKSLEKKEIVYRKLRMTTRAHEKRNGTKARGSQKNKFIIWEIPPTKSGDRQRDQPRYSEKAWFIRPTLVALNSVIDSLIDDTEDILARIKIDAIKRSVYYNLMVDKYKDEAIAPIKKLEEIILKSWNDRDKDLWDY